METNFKDVGKVIEAIFIKKLNKSNEKELKDIQFANVIVRD